jgi:hypothetical protein
MTLSDLGLALVGFAVAVVVTGVLLGLDRRVDQEGQEMDRLTFTSPRSILVRADEILQ